MKKYHHCVKFTYPLSFQTRIPKVDQHTGGKWLIHGTKHRKDNWITKGLKISIKNNHRLYRRYLREMIRWLIPDIRNIKVS